MQYEYNAKKIELEAQQYWGKNNSFVVVEDETPSQCNTNIMPKK